MKELLFLDEIAEMPLTTQVKVLRAIEFKEFMRIGAETVTKVDVRIIAATNKDLQEEVDTRRFREDLFFRLKAVSLSIPPLRKRKEDIELLSQSLS
jgi:transcriptional regulator with PAS, ATPase and Fis domain